MTGPIRADEAQKRKCITTILANTHSFYAVHARYEIVVMNSIKRLGDQRFEYFMYKKQSVFWMRTTCFHQYF